MERLVEDDVKTEKLLTEIWRFIVLDLVPRTYY